MYLDRDRIGTLYSIKQFIPLTPSSEMLCKCFVDRVNEVKLLSDVGNKRVLLIGASGSGRRSLISYCAAKGIRVEAIITTPVDYLMERVMRDVGYVIVVKPMSSEQICELLRVWIKVLKLPEVSSQVLEMIGTYSLGIPLLAILAVNYVLSNFRYCFGARDQCRYVAEFFTQIGITNVLIRFLAEYGDSVVSILKALTRGPQSISSITELSALSPHVCRRLLRNLWCLNLVRRVGVRYELTPKGVFILDVLLSSTYGEYLLGSLEKFYVDV
ncbi:MAG: hypothetical protein DRJ40_08900 [Thermoprotei archaeon]|nr:MAG: hypothetical protein DRJ40_08900 [Thermoprotei archaeon]